MADTAKLGAKIDELFSLEKRVADENARLRAKLAPIEEKIKTLEAEILNNFTAAEIGGASGKLATAERKTIAVPAVKDWDAFYRYIAKNRAFELLHRRVSTTAWAERVDAGVKIPGVDTFRVIKLSVRKKTTKN